MGSKSVTATRQPSTTRLDFSDHRAMAEHWGREAVKSIQSALVDPFPTTANDLDLDYAVRATRIAVGHALKLTRSR